MLTTRPRTPQRSPSRFPASPPPATPPAAPSPRLRWCGRSPALRAELEDHAAAAGIVLADAAAEHGSPGAEGPAEPLPVHGEVLDAEELTRRGGSWSSPSPHAQLPRLVVVPDGPVSPLLWEAALACGARALIALPSGSDALLAQLAQITRPRAASHIIGVAAACGGAGASSLAARLAGAARGDGPVTLLDADPLGGGLDLLVEAPTADGVRWEHLGALGQEDGEALRAGLAQVDGISLLHAGEGPGATPATLEHALGALSPLGGTLVVDLAPSLVRAAMPHLDRLLVLVPSDEHAVRAARRRLTSWDAPVERTVLVVRRRGPLTPAEVGEDLGLRPAAWFRDGPRGAVPLLDRRRRGADAACRRLLPQLIGEAAS